MEVSNEVIKLIIKECCRSLSYNDDERQFSFLLRPSLQLQNFWGNNKNKIREYNPEFILDDFNEVLRNLESPGNSLERISCTSLKDEEIINGEVLIIEILGLDSCLKIVKMERGQYFNVNTGTGLSLGDKFEFSIDKNITTSEGVDYGICKSISLLLPTKYDIVLSSVYLGKYYLNNVGDSLWPLYNEITNIDVYNSEDVKNILPKCKSLGIGVFPLFNILKGVCVLTT